MTVIGEKSSERSHLPTLVVDVVPLSDAGVVEPELTRLVVRPTNTANTIIVIRSADNTTVNTRRHRIVY